MPTAVLTPAQLDELFRGIVSRVVKMMRERGHGQVIVNVRDGVVQYITEQRQYKPENLPKS